MKTEPITPARIEFGDVPYAPLFDDLYHPRMGALEQARHVFLQGNDLPQRWSGRARFTILETGFGLGNNFLASWQAWRDDAQRCRRLFFVSIERHPPAAADLARAHADSPLRALATQLQSAWPPLTPNLHVLDFEGGRVQLLLGLGDVARLLPELHVEADAFFLDGFAPARNPQMWQPWVLKALGRKAAPGATLATWSVARELREGLTSAGFDVRLAPGAGGKREITLARFAPRHAPRIDRAAPPAAIADAGQAVVVGAGIAGAAAARALLAAGLQVTVIDRRAAPAAETSGNPAGLYHGTVHADDGPHARLFRAASQVARHDYGGACGVLRRGGLSLPAMQALLAQQNVPPEYLQALDAGAASALAGVPLAEPAWWFYPGGGWLDAGAWIRRQLAQSGLTWIADTAVARLGRGDQGWLLHDAGGHTIARAPIVVLANAAGAAPLLAPLGYARWPLTHSRGQVTVFRSTLARRLRLPVAGDGYAIPLGDDTLLCGATREDGDPAPDDLASLREADHRHNIDRLQRLTGLTAPADAASWAGRAGWRLQSADRLPIAGAMPSSPLPAGQRMDQVRLLPREPGLFVLTALGARGLTLAPLLGRLVAAQATGAPWPLEQDLAAAIDPARWLVRAARRRAGERESQA